VHEAARLAPDRNHVATSALVRVDDGLEGDACKRRNDRSLRAIGRPNTSVSHLRTIPISVV
jgi:hypothetical protein